MNNKPRGASQTPVANQVKPVLSVVASANISIPKVVYNLGSLCSRETSHSRIIAAHVFWFFLILCAPKNGSATILLTACSNDAVILAADGLQLHPTDHTYSEGCKIIQGSGDCFFAISGMQDNKSIRYNLVPLAKRTCQGAGSLPERSARFQKLARPEIQRAWKYVKAHDPTTYAFIKAKGPNRISVVFVGGPPFTVAIIEFVEDAQGNMAPSPNPILDIGRFGKQPSYKEVGSVDVEVYHRKHPEIDKLDDLNFVRSLLLGAISVEQEKTVPVHEIGQPVAILKIDTKGASWVVQGKCEAIHTTQKKPITRK